jgi:hypothetical protein
LKDISVTQRGWTLDVLNIVRRLSLTRPAGHPLPSDGRGTFTTADAYVFTRELEKLHPDNPVNDTGRESASNFKSFRLRFASARQGATWDCCCTSSVFATLPSSRCFPETSRRDKSAVAGVCRKLVWSFAFTRPG